MSKAHLHQTSHKTPIVHNSTAFSFGGVLCPALRMTFWNCWWGIQQHPKHCHSHFRPKKIKSYFLSFLGCRCHHSHRQTRVCWPVRWPSAGWIWRTWWLTWRPTWGRRRKQRWGGGWWWWWRLDYSQQHKASPEGCW